jgi:hypothetical protein
MTGSDPSKHSPFHPGLEMSRLREVAFIVVISSKSRMLSGNPWLRSASSSGPTGAPASLTVLSVSDAR